MLELLNQLFTIYIKYLPEIKASISYYLRLIVWVGILFCIITILTLIPNKTLSSLKSVICYALLLLLLLYCKHCNPNLYDNIRWFCAPGNVFLKSWISLFFYVFLIRVPVDLLPVYFPQIISWIFQCVLGNIIALGLTSGSISLGFYIIRKITNSDLDKLDFDPIIELNKTAIDHNIDYIDNKLLEESDFAQIEMSNVLESKNDKDINSNSKQSSDPISIPVKRGSNDLNTELANSLRDLSMSFSIPIRDASVIGTRTNRILSIKKASTISKEVNRVKSQKLNETALQSQLPNSNTNIQTNNRASEVRPSLSTIYPNFNNNMTVSTSIPELYTISEYDRDTTLSRASLSNVKIIHDFTISDRFSEIKRESITADCVHAEVDSITPEPQPYIPPMIHLLYFWLFLSFISIFIEYLSINKKKSNIILFQISSTISVFIGSIIFRLYLISNNFHWLIISSLQSVVIFLPIVIFLVIFTTNDNYKNWESNLLQYKTSLSLYYFHDWGAGDIISMLLPSAISSLAFSTVDSLCQYYKLMPLVIPAIWISCILIILQGAVLAYILQSPSVTALTLLTRTITTPVAVEIAELTGASTSITAASTIISAMISYLYAPYFLNLMNITNPISRGIGSAVSGTLLGVLSMDENGENIAAGIGMAGYGIATILYAITMAITNFRDFVVQTAVG